MARWSNVSLYWHKIPDGRFTKIMDLMINKNFLKCGLPMTFGKFLKVHKSQFQITKIKIKVTLFNPSLYMNIFFVVCTKKCICEKLLQSQSFVI